MDMRTLMNLFEAAPPPGYDPVLNGGYEIAQYIDSLSKTDLDLEFIEEYYGRRTTAVLKLVPIDQLREGDADHNIRSAAKEKRYAKMDLATMPPLVVQDGVVEDGNHRFRVAKAKGAEALWCYVVE